MGLYDDDNAAVTSGDVLDVVYFQTKFAQLKLDAALKSRQPEHAVGSLIPSVINGAEDVLKTYPNHAEVKGWVENGKKLQGKISSTATPEDFKADFAHWKDYSYEAGWRSYHVAKMAFAAQKLDQARQHASETITQFGRSQDRMTNWPADVQQFVKSAKAEMEQLLEQIKAKSK
ncbi:MAG TPA: hypothetical protein VEA69_19165 [Tepidisphaeraceae bacterium]|nr:hypothetical protein [Tepidisphaeraceae bacterium]